MNPGLVLNKKSPSTWLLLTFFLFLSLLLFLESRSATTSSNEEFSIEIVEHPTYIPKIENGENSTPFLIKIKVKLRNPENYSSLRLKAYIKPENASSPASQLWSETEKRFLYPHSSWSNMPEIKPEAERYIYTMTLCLRLYNYSSYHNQMRFARSAILKVLMREMEEGKTIYAQEKKLNLLTLKENGLKAHVKIEINTLHNPENYLDSIFSSVNALLLKNESTTLTFVAANMREKSEGHLLIYATSTLPESLFYKQEMELNLTLSLLNNSLLLFKKKTSFQLSLTNKERIFLNCTLSAQSPDLPSLIITEIYYNPLKRNEVELQPPSSQISLFKYFKWLELYHSSPFLCSNLNITLLFYSNGEKMELSLKKELFLEPYSHIILLLSFLSENEKKDLVLQSECQVLFLGAVEDSNNLLKEEGGEIQLLLNGEKMDSVSYGFFDRNGEPFPERKGFTKKGMSLLRVCEEANFSKASLVPSTPSPGTENFLPLNLTTEITTFSSPDTIFQLFETNLRRAKESIYIKMYSFSHPEMVSLLIDVAKDGVDIKIILERHHATEWEQNYTYLAAAHLYENNVEVRWSPFNAKETPIFNHEKFVVVDNSTLLLSSANFGWAGLAQKGDFGNREWGVVVKNHQVIYDFIQRFLLHWQMALPYDFYPQENEERDLHYLKFPSPPKKSVLPLFFKDENFLFKYSPQFIPIEKIVEMENEMVEYPVKREEERELLLESVFSPNSLPALLKLVREAEETIFMEYMYFDPSWNDTEHMNPLLSELVNASMRGVDIKIILDSMPSYNSELVEVLSSLSCSNISLAYFNNGFFNTLHNKAMLIDSKTVLISSINLNHNSIMRNLEAGIIIRNRDVTTFYKNLFEFDWKLSLPILNGEEMNKESNSPPPIFVKIYPNPYVKNDLNEFFVIYNPGEAKLNLSGWYLTDLEHIVTFPLNSFINPKEELLICRDPLSLVQETHYTPDFYYHFDEKIKGNWVRMLFSPLFIGLNRARGFTTFNSTGFGELRLNNEGDEIFLLNQNFEIVDVVCYGKNWNYVGKGFAGSYIPAPSEGTLLVRNHRWTTSKEAKFVDTDSANDWLSPRIYKINQSNFSFSKIDFKGNVTALAFPEAGVRAIFLEMLKAKHHIYINAYQMTHLYFLPVLLNLLNNGVEVRILLEGFPMEHIPDEEKYILNQLDMAGAEIGFMINNESLGIHDRYLFNHAKYMIIDNETLILLTENLKPSGLPFNPMKETGNRGWGVIVHNKEVASFFTKVFFTDFDSEMRDIFIFKADDPEYGAPSPSFSLDSILSKEEVELFSEILFNVGESRENFKKRIEDLFLDKVKDNSFLSLNDKFELIPFVGPDCLALENDPILNLISSARKSIFVELLSSKPNWNRYNKELENLYLEALFKKAKMGINVKMILDTRYNNLSSTPDNYDCFLYIKEKIKNENLSNYFKIKLYNGTHYLKIHNKGMVVDSEKVLISSVNWSPGGVLENRESGVIIKNVFLARFFENKFNHDWNLSKLSNLNALKETEEKHQALFLNIGFSILLYVIFHIGLFAPTFLRKQRGVGSISSRKQNSEEKEKRV